MATTPPNEIQTSPKPTAVSSSNRVPDEISLGSNPETGNGDPVVSALEGSNSGLKGSYSNPKIIKFPLDVSSGQYPHVMQFKIYWRWERKDLQDERNAAVKDREEEISKLESLRERLDAGEVPASIASRAALGGPDVPYEQLSTDTKVARQQLEERIKSEQTQLEELNRIGKVTSDTDETLQAQDRINNAIQNASIGESAVTSGIASGLVAGGASWLTGGGGKAALKTGGIAALAGAATSAAALATVKVAQNEPVYDQMVSIYLPFCTKINNEDSFVYEDTSGTGVIRGLLDASQGFGSALDAASQGLEAGAQNIQAGGLGTAIALGRGLIVNPRLEKLFKQKDMRTFTFSWELYPRNEDEVKAIRELVYTFRYHASPAKTEEVIGNEPSNTQVNLRVPAEFAVKFMSYNTRNGESNFQENPYIPKIARCAITSISADFTANSVYSSFKNDSPTAVTLTIQMSEITTQTREIIEKGF